MTTKELAVMAFFERYDGQYLSASDYFRLFEETIFEYEIRDAERRYSEELFYDNVSKCSGDSMLAKIVRCGVRS